MSTSKPSATPSEQPILSLEDINKMFIRGVISDLTEELNLFKSMVRLHEQALVNIIQNKEERDVSEIQEFCRRILEGGSAPSSRILQ